MTDAPLTPLEALGRELDAPPIVAGPAERAQPAPADPPPARRPPGGDRPRGQIWADCPVKPLGVNGATYYYLDIHGQLRAVAKHDAQSIMMLFGHMIPRLCLNFPQFDKDGGIKRDRFDQTSSAMTMIRACSEKGLFDPDNAVRGVGAWSDDDGQLIYHTGDRMFIGAREEEPTSHQGRIYPAFPPIPHPTAPAKGADPAAEVIEALETWQWGRPDIDPMIVLGLFGVQAFGGALDWRPAYWISGGPGTGKSGLQRLMLMLHGGDKGLIQSTDTTARGIASLLGQSTLPVSVDELEPGDQGSTKERDIIMTARVAASGGRWVRGSSDQKGSTGQLRSTFLFSSVLVPGVLKSQDLQRLILLTLRPFPDGAKPPTLRAETWRKRGAALKRIIIDRWPSWTTRLDLWREAFAEHGIAGRDADNWATTLAMGQMILGAAEPSAEELSGWTAKIARHIKADLTEATTDSDEVLVHLLSQPYDVMRRGEQFTVGQWVMVAAQSPGAPRALLEGFATDAQGREQRAREANAKLAKALIRVLPDPAGPRLFVGSAKAQTLLDLFSGTQWAGGAWKQSLERIKGAQLADVVRTLAGIRSRGVEVPLSAIPGLGVFAQDREAAPPSPAEPPAYSAEDFM